MPVDRALAEIDGGAGTQFDPQVVRVFVRMIEDGLSTANDEDFAAALRQAG
jgi:HD-GYP domain-containing protein (c-di-GMP phosphodiesterase class II)